MHNGLTDLGGHCLLLENGEHEHLKLVVVRLLLDSERRLLSIFLNVSLLDILKVNLGPGHDHANGSFVVRRDALAWEVKKAWCENPFTIFLYVPVERRTLERTRGLTFRAE